MRIVVTLRLQWIMFQDEAAKNMLAALESKKAA